MNLLSQSTFELRLVRYLYELQVKGYFTYKEIYKFYPNGDLAVNDVVKANLTYAYENDLLSWGASWHGLKSYSSNPYEFIIYKNQGPKIKIIGIELSSKIQIDTTIDKDIFDMLLINFLTRKTFEPQQ